MIWQLKLGKLLSKTWIFPIVFLSSLLVGTWSFSYIDGRDIINGDKAHSVFPLLLEDEKNMLSLKMLSEMDNIAQPPIGYSFYLSKLIGKADLKDYKYQYTVIHLPLPFSNAPKKQLIEVKYHNADMYALVRYIVQEQRLIPIYSRIFTWQYIYSALPYALGISLLIWLIGRLLIRFNEKLIGHHD